MRKEQSGKNLRREVVDYKRRSRKGIRLLEVAVNRALKV
jgi:hypothetical protein